MENHSGTEIIASSKFLGSVQIFVPKVQISVPVVQISVPAVQISVPKVQIFVLFLKGRNKLF